MKLSIDYIVGVILNNLPWLAGSFATVLVAFVGYAVYVEQHYKSKCAYQQMDYISFKGRPVCVDSTNVIHNIAW